MLIHFCRLRLLTSRLVVRVIFPVIHLHFVLNAHEIFLSQFFAVEGPVAFGLQIRATRGCHEQKLSGFRLCSRVLISSDLLGENRWIAL